jgi:hypothetical protein
MQSTIELVWITAAQNASETHRESAHDDKAGRGLSQNDDLSILGGRKSPRGPHAERSGYDWRD